MRTPVWEPSAGALVAFLATAETAAFVDCFRFEFPFGDPGPTTVLRLTSAEINVTVTTDLDAAQVWQAYRTQPVRDTVTVRVGVDVDTLGVTLSPFLGDGTLDVFTGSALALTQAAGFGLFDGAEFALYRAVLSAPPVLNATPDIRGVVKLFAGQVAEARVTDHEIDMDIESALQDLQRTLPRNILQPGCLNTLYDDVCAISRTATIGGNALFFTSTVIAGFSNTAVVSMNAAPPQGSNFFDLGYLQIDAGPFKGIRRSIKRQNGQVVELIEPLPFMLDNGQAVRLQRGCAKDLPTCTTVFQNRDRFRGFPYVPVPDTAG